DDVIDEGDLRRGRKSARTLWGNQASILAGDYLYATGVAKGLTLNNHEVNRVLQTACCRMIEGEMAQNLQNGNLKLIESEYMEIIRHKTASLIAAACRLSGLISGARPDQIEALEQVGLNLGMAFQVADDLLDYTAESERLGKRLGADLKEGKITLPLLHVLQECSSEENNLIARMVGSSEADERTLAKILELMTRHGSLRYAREAAAGFVERAKNQLSCFEPSAHKSALEVVADYVVSRDH
ncbi:MAG TPA: polyprenyl synthetase family protein, partial [Nitrospiria bacterium]